MNRNASLLAMDFHGDASIAALLAALEPHGEKALVIDYDGRLIRPGYHVTEVKAGSFVTLDCGGNPDAWRETILQIEDLGPDDAQEHMSVGKFRAILGRVAGRIAMDADARLTFEVGPPGEAMQVFDAGALSIETGRVVLRLVARMAICKPRHRALQAAAASSGAKPASGACCTP